MWPISFSRPIAAAPFDVAIATTSAFVDEPGVLAGADVLGVFCSTRKCEVVERAASTFQPSKDAGPGRFEQLELDRPPGFALNDDRTRANTTAADEVADPDLDDVAAAQLAVDREVEHGAVADPTLLVKPEPNSPHLWWFERALCA